MSHPTGEKHHASKLTEDKVKAIREAYSREPRPTMKEVAAEFGVSQTTVFSIIHRQRWAK
jgi:Mn-dependent DtxR family transcriptional regulator